MCIFSKCMQGLCTFSFAEIPRKPGKHKDLYTKNCFVPLPFLWGVKWIILLEIYFFSIPIFIYYRILEHQSQMGSQRCSIPIPRQCRNPQIMHPWPLFKTTIFQGCPFHRWAVFTGKRFFLMFNQNGFSCTMNLLLHVLPSEAACSIFHVAATRIFKKVFPNHFSVFSSKV